MITPIKAIASQTLTNVTATYYTVPATTKQTVITNMSFLNTDSVARTVTVYFVPSGGTAGDTNARFKAMSVQPSSAGDPPPFFNLGIVMTAGETIQAKADTGAVVHIMANGIQYT